MTKDLNEQITEWRHELSRSGWLAHEALDGRGFVPIGYRSSELGIDDMSQLIELMFAWGAQNGVRFLDLGDERPTRRRKTKS